MCVCMSMSEEVVRMGGCMSVYDYAGVCVGMSVQVSVCLKIKS
jgi:hypothetical protein